MAASGHYSMQGQSPSPAGYQSLQPGQPPAHPGMSQPPPLTAQVKDLNPISLCRRGQEYVHDIVQKVQELFKSLGKNIQLPNAVNTTPQMYQERRVQLEETLKIIITMFRKLRAIYDSVNECAAQVESPTTELIPYVGSETETVQTNTEIYQLVADEHREVVEQVRLKNQEMKEIIDQIRTIIWEINTMLTMRKT